jgi:16S rRNA processing protein RimM
VAAEILTDFPERLLELKQAWLWSGEGEPRRVAVHSCWLSPSRGGRAIFHFAGVESIEAAEKLRGLEVQIAAAERAALPAGNYYITDLIGCEVWEEGTPRALGKVRDVNRATGTPVLEIDTAGGELLVPLANEICTRVDPAARRIEVRLPEGLRELNQSKTLTPGNSKRQD